MAMWAGKNADDAPAPVRLQMQLDLLVDDELPEARRSALLQRMDQTPDGWRLVAMRFLQHQVERRAVREMIGLFAENHGGSAEAPSHRRGGRLLQALRIAAAVLVTATLFSLAGLYIGLRFNAARPAMTTAFAPATAQRPIHFSPAPSSGAIPGGYPLMNGGAAKETRNIVVVSDGAGRVVAFPVVPAVAVKESPVY